MTDRAPDRLSARLARRIRLARLVLWWEAAWVALWPPLGVIGLFLVVALSGLTLALPWPLHLLLLAGFAGALAWAGQRAARHLAAPGIPAAERRLERDSGLAHRPIATIGDRPTGQDPVALALWQAHRRRAAEALARLRVARPRPGLPAHDRRALRGGLAVALVAALVAAGTEAPERLRRALVPNLGGTALPAAPGVRLEAWITPPAYTGAAPVFLDPAGGTASVPAGSRLQVALSGGAGGVPDLVTDGTAATTGTPDHIAAQVAQGFSDRARPLTASPSSRMAFWAAALSGRMATKSSM